MLSGSRIGTFLMRESLFSLSLLSLLFQNDFKSLFQAVDRVIIAMIQRDEPFIFKDGLLDIKTRIVLSENIFERWNRIELFRGERIRFSEIVYKCAGKMAAYIRGEEKIYKPYIAKW